MDYYYGWKPYVPVWERQRNAMREMEKRRKKGHAISPISIEGRAIAKTFWGKAWCENLERYSDYANRLPRGRTYVRSGCVIDLKIGSGIVKALVSGTIVYQVQIRVEPIAKTRWNTVCAGVAGGIDSLVQLLPGECS